MEHISSPLSGPEQIENITTQKLEAVSAPNLTDIFENEVIQSLDTLEISTVSGKGPAEEDDTLKLERVSNQTPAAEISINELDEKDPHDTPGEVEIIDGIASDHAEHQQQPAGVFAFDIIETPREFGLSIENEAEDEAGSPGDLSDTSTTRLSMSQRAGLTRGQALLLVGLLCVLVFQAINMGSTQFLGPQGWSYILNGPPTNSNNLLQTINQRIHQHGGPIAGATPQAALTPQQYINLIMQNMTLDQKLGQMMIVQFTGPSYSLDLSTMISQYDVGAVLIFAANDNIVSKDQLRGLITQMQSNGTIPLAVAIDQEGGTVDRLRSLDGPRPSATAIGATNDPNKAFEAGLQDARDLSNYGINLNLAPVVDVTNVYNSQLYLRTYGTNPDIVTKMARAYLQGLQQSGKVLGTLKHFPGLGDVTTDPHNAVPYLNRSLSELEAIDWAPYRALIAQGNVYSVMVTHEIVRALDDSKPSSLSKKIVTGILRDQLGFQGVIVTDSLTMEGITAYYTPGQAAALAVEAGADLLMGATTPGEVATMIEGIKQDISAGTISMQRIDDSVRRILLLKYQMGLIHIPNS